MYIAHINEDTGECQSVKEHSLNVAKLCQEFAIEKLRDLAYIMGLLHDIGKYQSSFQKRINGTNIRVEHSHCGAIAAWNLEQNIAGQIMAYCIAGHHTGLPDGGSRMDDAGMSTLAGRLKGACENYEAYQYELLQQDNMPHNIDINEISNFLMEDCSNNNNKVIDKLSFIVRYCFSCLTDADSIDSAGFNGVQLENPLHTDFVNCLNRLNKHLAKFNAVTLLQKKRTAIQKQVYQGVDEDAHVYTINMPTGSGKTLCSVKFALERAIRTTKKRIIYVIPYNSIIDQTAEVFQRIFAEDMALLRHQCTFIYEDEENSEENILRYRYNTENWQAEFIITTAVQFFESTCAYKKSKLRKLHNMADSIIVFDEIHKLPIGCIKPCMQVIACITKYLNSEALLMSATLPDIRTLMDKYSFDNVIVHDLVKDKSDFKYFRKCSYQYLGLKTCEDVVQHSLSSPASLIVVNKKRIARELFQFMTGEKYHLSTYMTAMDRIRTINKIKSRLHKLAEEYPQFDNVPEERRIHVVSTSLIEAGVDLDFDRVYREMTSLDSILQAGGRCNREGFKPCGDVYIFELNQTSTIDASISITKGLMQEFEELDSQECIEQYYKRLYANEEINIEKTGMSGQKVSSTLNSIAFREAEIHMIDSPVLSLIIPQDDICCKLIKQLEYSGKAPIRGLQPYASSVYEQELSNLMQQGVVKNYDGIYCLTDIKYYDQEIGVLFEGQDYIIDEGGFVL